MGTSGMEYKNKKDETPFEVFLRYTDEKENSSAQLAKILQETANGSSILDIGTGNGEYLSLALTKVKDFSDIRLTLIEPSVDLVKQLHPRFDRFMPRISTNVVCVGLDDFSSDEKFDVVLASHLFYHIPRDTWPQQLEQTLSFLKPNGRLIIVLREEDDAYAFKMAFKPLIFSKDFKALVIGDVLAALPATNTFDIARYSVASTLKIPIDKNIDDTISIIEFYLNEHWKNIPKPIQTDALNFIKAKDGTFKQRDGIAVISK